MSDICGNPQDYHDWHRGETLQWGEAGLPYEAAQTPYECTKCKATFIHFYHQEPNIYAVMTEAGIDPTRCQS
jgi:hypothetical protein